MFRRLCRVAVWIEHKLKSFHREIESVPRRRVAMLGVGWFRTLFRLELGLLRCQKFQLRCCDCSYVYFLQAIDINY